MKFRKIFSLALVLVICFSFAGCESGNRPSKNSPVTITMWHNYGGDMQKTMDALIDEFNSTVGADKGINISVTAISSSKELNQSLDMIANDDPGAPEMPDICTAYPKIAIKFLEKDKIADLSKYFDEKELSLYVDAFIEEGKINDGLYVFPIAKSTEIIYLNQTLFDEFANATGVKVSDLAAFEGIAKLSEEYYKWSGGKQFFTADSWFNVAQVGMKQKGNTLFDAQNKLNLENDTYKGIFKTIYDATVNGGIAMYDGYSSDLAKTGDIILSTGSSAGILFYGDTITTDDNVTREVEYNILPYPIFEGGENIAIQRGGGLMVKKSEEKKEYAASVFIKWLTDAKQNMRFVSETGYLPVSKKAFEEEMPKHIDSLEDSRIKKMLLAVTDMYERYTFFTAPNFPDFDDVSDAYEKDFKDALKNAQNIKKNGEEAVDALTAAGNLITLIYKR